MDPSERDGLIEQLRAGNDRQRRAASYKLSKSGDAAVVPALMKAIEDVDSSVRQNAIAGLRAADSQEALEFLAAHQIDPAQPPKPKDDFGNMLGCLGILIAISLIVMCGSALLSSNQSLMKDLKALLMTGEFQTIMKQSLELAAIITVGVLAFTLPSLLRVKDPNLGRTQTVWQQLLNGWLTSMSAIVVALLVASFQPTGLASIGIHAWSPTDNAKAAMIGIVCLLGLVWAYYLFWRLGLRRKRADVTWDVDQVRPHIAAVLKYRGGWQRLAYLTELAVGVTAEDLVYRGCLVLLLGHRTGRYIPWVILSVALSVFVHLHQGTERGTIAFHVVAASFFIGMTLLTQNVLAAIVPHMLYDVRWTQGWWNAAAKRQAGEAAPTPTAKGKLACAAFIGGNALMLGAAVSVLMS